MDRGIFNVDIAQTNVKVLFLHGNFRDESVSTMCLKEFGRRII